VKASGGQPLLDCESFKEIGSGLLSCCVRSTALTKSASMRGTGGPQDEDHRTNVAPGTCRASRYKEKQHPNQADGDAPRPTSTPTPGIDHNQRSIHLFPACSLLAPLRILRTPYCSSRPSAFRLKKAVRTCADGCRTGAAHFPRHVDKPQFFCCQ
jgi:hypothetical protein